MNHVNFIKRKQIFIVQEVSYLFESVKYYDTGDV